MEHKYTECFHCCATILVIRTPVTRLQCWSTYLNFSLLYSTSLKKTPGKNKHKCQKKGKEKYLQFITLNRLLLWGLLHKVRDEDFQCGSSWSLHQITSESSDVLQHANLPVQQSAVYRRNIYSNHHLGRCHKDDWLCCERKWSRCKLDSFQLILVVLVWLHQTRLTGSVWCLSSDLFGWWKLLQITVVRFQSSTSWCIKYSLIIIYQD